MAPRPRFDPKRPLVAAREFTFAGKAYKPGDPFAPEGVADRLRARQYEARAVNFGEGEAAEAPPAEQVTMTGPAGGRYTITAPWLAEPEVVRGKVNAEKRLAELREAGPPLGFIEGGSAVTVEGGEGGWYDVSAPWLDAPEKVQGRELAEARQREIHEAGEPDTYKGVTLTAGENGWYSLTREGFDTELKVQGEDNARAAAATLRAGELIEGQPADWPTAQQAEGEGGTEGEGGDADPPAAQDPPEGGEPSETPAPAATETGGETAKETDVDQQDKTGNEPNEPGTNEPNGAEVINDEQAAETGNARSGDDADGDDGDGSEGGDGTTGTVGP